MADVASDLRSWSATASSNSPAGTTVIGGGLDDNLRELQKVVRQDLATKGSDIASATTTDLGAVAGLMHDITGTTTITGFGTVSAGIWKIIKFEGALTLTHNATSLILPGAANITTADGDVAIVMSEGSGNWRCHSYQRANGTPVSGITLGTEQASTSGTSIDFTGIPSWAKEITIMLEGVSLDATAALRIQLGDAGGLESAGYVGAVSTCVATATGAAGTAGMDFPSLGAAAIYTGTITLRLKDAANFTWAAGISVGRSDSADALVGGYTKSTSAALTQLSITTVAGTANFDAGSINIQYS